MRRAHRTAPRDRHAILVRLPVSLHRKIKAKADAERRSVNSEVTVALESWVQKEAA